MVITFLLFIHILGDVYGIILHRDKIGLYDDWFVEHVSVVNKESGDESAIAHFPLNRWLPPNKQMHFEKFDSQLPQIVKARNPGIAKQREDELKTKQEDFNYAPIGNVEGMPRSVSLKDF